MLMTFRVQMPTDAIVDVSPTFGGTCSTGCSKLFQIPCGEEARETRETTGGLSAASAVRDHANQPLMLPSYIAFSRDLTHHHWAMPEGVHVIDQASLLPSTFTTSMPLSRPNHHTYWMETPHPSSRVDR